MNAIKFLSWNILGAQVSDRSCFEDRYSKVLDWQHRFTKIIDRIKSYDADVICLQEVDEEHKQQFVDALQPDGFAQGSYEVKGKNGGVLVLYKASMFDLVDAGLVVLDNYGKLKQPGAVAWSVLSMRDGKQLCAASVHLHWQDGQQQVEQFTHELGKLQIGVPTVIAGDFNQEYKVMCDQVVPAMNKGLALQGGRMLQLFDHQSWTAQTPNCRQGQLGKWMSIDHCLYSSDIQIDKNQSFVGSYDRKFGYQVHDNSMLPSDQYPSDHLPVLITFFI